MTRKGCVLGMALLVGLQAAFAAGGKSAAELEAMSRRFAPTKLEVATENLSPGDQKALEKLIAAARPLDEIYMQQLWSGNAAELAKLRKDVSPLGRARLHYFWLNKGPWSNLDANTAFLPGVPERRLPGANFYPPGLTREAFDTWAGRLAWEDARVARGFYSIIVKGPKGLEVVPYSKAYAQPLARSAALLREAAALTDNASLKRFLLARADAFASDNYYASDVAWMDVDAPIDVTIGPYETYTDELFGYKAAFEAHVSLRDDRETARLGILSQHLQTLEDNLPEAPKHRNPKLGALSPVRVVNDVFSSGDGAHGVLTAAYNLPNDERVVHDKGSKRVMLKNLQEAKFTSILVPIAAKVLSPADQKYVSFDWFFVHILAHELMHGLGPHQITLNGTPSNPRAALKNLFSAIEEAKADITGLWALQYMLDHAKEMNLEQVITVDADAERKLYTTYLASMFRTMRFGATEAHARGMALQFNFLLDRKAVRVTESGTFEVNYAEIKDAVRDLDTVLLTMEAEGDFAEAQRRLDAATLRPEVAKAIEHLKDVPIDIEPLFTTADRISPAPP